MNNLKFIERILAIGGCALLLFRWTSISFQEGAIARDFDFFKDRGEIALVPVLGIVCLTIGLVLIVRRKIRQRFFSERHWHAA